MQLEIEGAVIRRAAESWGPMPVEVPTLRCPCWPTLRPASRPGTRHEDDPSDGADAALPDRGAGQEAKGGLVMVIGGRRRTPWIDAVGFAASGSAAPRLCAISHESRSRRIQAETCLGPIRSSNPASTRQVSPSSDSKRLSCTRPRITTARHEIYLYNHSGIHVCATANSH